MKLHFIVAANQDGENLDLFVWEADKVEALKRWQAWVHENFGHFEDAKPDQVFEVPSGEQLNSMPARVLEWHEDVVKL